MTNVNTAPSSVEPRLQIIRLSKLCLMLGVSPTTIWRWRNQSHMKFPRPVYLGSRSLGWKLADIETWINSKTLAEDKA